MTHPPATPGPDDPVPGDEDGLARLLDGVLRDLGPRRAPPTLESRVLAQIARRRMNPGTLRSFRHWPLGARALFLAVSFALIGIMLAGVAGVPFPAPLDQLSSGEWLRPVAIAAAFLQSLPASFAAITALADAPAAWLTTALAAVALLYAALFGLGAAAYRLLYLRPRLARPTIDMTFPRVTP